MGSYAVVLRVDPLIGLIPHTLKGAPPFRSPSRQTVTHVAMAHSCLAAYSLGLGTGELILNRWYLRLLCPALSGKVGSPSIKCPLEKVKMLLKGTKDLS